MMDGYSVQEAATVLGVAEGRVWELLARGVLSGTPEGDSMRVFLKATASPMAPPPAREEPPKTNGNGGSHGNGGEVSAFRELLTEFRNLTERYGQALLALGEARGEVAGLRSRVELLEARLDLRLPPALDESPIAWGTVAPTPPAPGPPLAASVESEMPAPAPVRRSPRPRPRKKPRSKKIAMTGFAEALARAQDPSPADLAGALAPEDLAADQIDQVAASVSDVFETIAEAETAAEPRAEAFDTIEPYSETEMVGDTAADIAADVADDVAATRAEEPEPETAASAVDLMEAAAEPGAEAFDEIHSYSETEMEGDLAAEIAADVAVDVADDVDATVAEEPQPEVPSYSAAVVEPDWFADGDFAWLDAADVEARSQPQASGPDVPEAVAEVAPELEAATEPEPEIHAEATAEEAMAEVIQAAELDPQPALEPEPMTVSGAEEVELAVADREAVVEPGPALESEVALEAEPYQDEELSVEPPPSLQTEPLVPDEPDPPVVQPWGFRTDPAVVAEPPFLAGEPLVEAEAEAELETGPEPMADESSSPVASDIPYYAVEPELGDDSYRQAEPIAMTEPEPAAQAEPEPHPIDPGPAAPDRYDPAPEFRSIGVEEEVMWIGDDRETASEIESASHVSPVTPAEPWPVADSAPGIDDSTRPPLAMTEEELAQLARDEGWNEAEVAAIRAMIQRPGSPAGGLPGGEELDEAIAALHAVPVEAAGDAEAPHEWAKSTAADEDPPPYEDWTFELEPALDQIPPPRAVPRRPLPDPGRTRRRRGPAATAYRRLRRLFPG